MPRKNYTPAERALHLIGALAGKDHHKINCFIIQGDTRKEVPKGQEKLLPEGVLDMLKRYAPTLTAEVDWLRETKIGGELWINFWDHCVVRTDFWDDCVVPKKVGDT